MLNVDTVSVHRGTSVALEGVSLTIAQGKTLAVVGESGAGKSTLIASILGLLRPSKGTITWSGAPVQSCRPALVMQEPRSALNPAWPLLQSVMEPITARKARLSSGRLERLCAGLELPVELLDRKSTEISIGQAQRVGILRALIAAPPLILFDEPLSALDAVTQKHTARLISDLQAEEGFAALIVTHDLGYACAYSDEIAVLKSGRIEEVSTPQAFVTQPQTDYGRTLRDAAFALGALEHAA
ncbi:ABC transporter ATP-binding protein [Tropicibacter sp. R16_0]|uniref:ABC transporter ATP-binding protein n=1 Tax=Tropicibacter sp. R16_0 TaxID=2821102 RepID=UPI001ADAB8F3|nr:dipeptide/oligopeptide/nickel ABC transporter ATP-binding protein [Tropicibacter sp. R16_0]MBO9452203.1 ABC transporter ATP-binding protein [Tropicibacter sp. R16_0]